MGDKKVKPDWVDVLQALWPVIIFIIAIAAWAIKSQTVSHASFNELSTRVTVVEEKMPSREIMIAIQSNQAVMRSQLDEINKHMDNVTNHMESAVKMWAFIEKNGAN